LIYVLPLTDQYQPLSPIRKEFFILDPVFPQRLARSGYERTLEFIQHMFEEYAQAGLSKRSDKEVAISGLLQRMQATLKSECIHGTFLCFLSRLLLWRVTNTNDPNSACLPDKEQKIPSWSWLSQDYIQFFPEEEIDVPEGLNSFNSKAQLDVLIFELQDFHMEEQGERHVLLHNDAQQIGEFWLDSHGKTQVQNCVIIGKSKYRLWFVLLVMKIGSKRYKRFGVGKIQRHYISNTSFKGVLE
jgi:hypothetical protein